MRKIIIAIILFILCAGGADARGRDPQKGYRGFVDAECFLFPNLGFLAGEGGDSDFWLGFGTVHGYQFNPHLFVGGGMSFVWMLNDQDYYTSDATLKYLPLFADIRTDLRFGRFTPFADLRMGCNLLEHGSFSGALTLGYRFSWGSRVAINLALGVNMRGVRHDEYISGWNEEEGMWSRPTGGHYTGYDVMPALRLGIEF
ncbi:MAG: hypothetical protein K2M55_04050 [Muribaculaceae bacterium]|nr:hypothetical protein [Muribaculaceae bacterium]